MKLLDLITERARVRKQAEDAYRKMLQAPLHKLLSLAIEMAIANGGDAICVGYLADKPVDAQTWKDHGARQVATAGQVPRMSGETRDPQSERNQKASEWNARLHSRDGVPNVPVWFRQGRELFMCGCIPVRLFPAFLQCVEDRLVSIGGTEAVPKPLRYIEYFSTDRETRRDAATLPEPRRSEMLEHLERPDGSETDDRLFVEVDLELKMDNTVWVHFQGKSAVDAKVNVQRHYY